MSAPPTRLPLPQWKKTVRSPAPTEHPEDLFQRSVVEGACTHRDIDVLHAQLANQRCFGNGAGLHGVPEIQDDLRTGLLQGLQMVGGWLAAGHDGGQNLAGVGYAGDRLKSGSHSSGRK